MVENDLMCRVCSGITANSNLKLANWVSKTDTSRVSTAEQGRRQKGKKARDKRQKGKGQIWHSRNISNIY